VSGGDFVSGVKNTAIGEISGRNFTRGNRNTFVGAESGNSSLRDGDDNIFLGYQTSIGGTIGLTYADRNVIIGNGARGYTGAATTMTNSVSIGFANRVDCDNCVTLASQVFDGLREQQVGIGYTNPGGVAIGTIGAEAKLYVDDYNGAGTAAFFNGDVYSSTGNYLTSDPMFKDNVQSVTNVDAILNQLEVKTFTYKISNFPSLTLPQGTHYGFLATDVEAVLPGAVKTFVNPAFYDSIGNLATAAFDFKAVNYTELVPVLFAAVKQQKAMLDSLAIVVSNCCNNPQPRINNGENPVIKSAVSLSNKETIILNQNAPNPFKDKTEITYTIPESVKDAVILFYDQSGKVIQKFEISHRGAGSLTVYGEDLTSGVYTYSLIIDGENHQTKRMVKQ